MDDFLECRGIHRWFGGLSALSDIHFKVRQGEMLGIIGPNGSGKTTVFNIISGTIPPTSGEVIFRHVRITGLRPSRICRLGIARTHQMVRLFPSMTPLENVMLGVCFGGYRCPGHADRTGKAMAILDFTGLVAKANHSTESLNLAEKRRLELARALATDPAVLLLDEPMAGLDPRGITQFSDKLIEVQARGTTIILIEHVLSVVRRLCERVIVLNHGAQLAYGPTHEVMNLQEVIEAYLGQATTPDAMPRDGMPCVRPCPQRAGRAGTASSCERTRTDRT